MDDETDRLEPPPEHRQKGGYHWVQVYNAPPRPAVWIDFYGDGSGTCWFIWGVGSIGAKHLYTKGWRYLGPATLPDGTQATTRMPEDGSRPL